MLLRTSHDNSMFGNPLERFSAKEASVSDHTWPKSKALRVNLAITSDGSDGGAESTDRRARAERCLIFGVGGALAALRRCSL